MTDWRVFEVQDGVANEVERETVSVAGRPGPEAIGLSSDWEVVRLDEDTYELREDGLAYFRLRRT